MILTEAINYSYYQSKLDPDTFDRLISIDPTSTHKYSRWIVDCYIKHPEWSEYIFNNAADIMEKLAKFYTYSARRVLPMEYRDIMKFKDIQAFILFMNSNAKSLEAKYQRTLPENNIKKLYSNKNNILVIPLSHEKARKYGTGSDWCTATSNAEHFINYSSEGTLYIHRWYNDDGTIDIKKGFQLYIPDSYKSEISEVDCRDLKNNIIDNIEKFFEDIPDAIADPIRQKIEDMGGLNAWQQIEIAINVDEQTENSITISVDAQLLLITMDDNIILDAGDSSTYSVATIFTIGSDIDNTLEQQFYTSEFNVRNGKGILIEYKGESNFEQVQEHANNKWPMAERDNSIDDYEVNKGLSKLLVNSTKLDYIIYKTSGPSIIYDYWMRDWLDGYFTFNSMINNDVIADYDTIEIANDKNERYTVIFNKGFNYSTVRL